MTVSNRDLILILGVIVAIIISITTWFHNSPSQTLQSASPDSLRNKTNKVEKIGQVAAKVGLPKDWVLKTGQHLTLLFIKELK